MPVVTRVDDSISKGETFMIYGEGFDDTSKVYVSPIESEEIPEYDDATNLVECNIVSVDENNQCLTVELSEDAVAGSNHLYVSNSHGVSYAVGLNTARPQWVSTDVVSDGDEFAIYGRNLSSAEFGGDSLSGVSFVNENGKAYDIPVSTVNPYVINCVMTDIPSGEYTVYVSNDGYIWNETEDGRKLTVVEKNYDPYNIGAALASKFDFTNVINVSEHPYYLDTGRDVTVNLQTIIDNVSRDGGGVVYLPKGEYYVTSITIKEGVVLTGDGIGKTVIKKTGPKTDFFIESGGNSKTGITEMSIEIPEGIAMPGFGIALGKTFDKRPTNERYVEFGFLKKISFETPMSAENGEGIGISIGGKGHFLIEDCIFKGYNSTLTGSYVNEYVQIKNNQLETVIGNLYTFSEYATISGNTIKRNPKDASTPTNTQGIFMRGFSFVANNMIFNLGNEYNSETGEYDSVSNDGEIICTEPYMGGTMLHGSILQATSDSVVLDVDTKNPNWNLDDVYYAKAYLCITEGRGLGQYSRIKSYDETTKTLVLEDGFKVLPDSTSRFIVASLCESVTIYNNYCENAEKGYWLYGDNVDAVIAGNTGINIEGVYVRGIYLDRVKTDNDETVYDNRQQIAYFVSVKDNHFKGGATSSGVCGIGVCINIESSDPSMTYIYGINMKENSITKNVPEQEYRYAHEAPHINGLYVVYFTRELQNKPYVVARGIIIEDNSVKNADQGITIGPFGYPNYNMTSYALGDMTGNVYIGENSFSNVDKTLVDDRGYSYN